jgi:hypothetical protein
MPIGRYVVAGLLAAAAVSGLLLLIRPLLFSLAPPLDDTNYTVASAAEAGNGPMRVEVLFNEPHGYPGELRRDEQAGLIVIVAPVGPAFSVVNAWSPTHDCAVTLGADRLLDCEGDAWTFDGVPLDPADPPLQGFPTRVSNGAVMVDFTRPFSPPAS